MDYGPLWLSLRLALVTTFLLLLVGIPLAAWLAQTRWRGKVLVEALVSLPLVLPPTVLGFYLLVVFSKNSPVGHWLVTHLGLELVFSFEGLVVGSMVYSLPFMVQPIQAGLQQLSPHLAEASYTLGKGYWETLFKVLLPNIRAELVTGVVLTFAHTVGEFGVVLMIGGSLPNETKVASIAIYEYVETLQYAQAHQYAALLLLGSFVVLVITYGWSAFLKK